MDDEQGGLRTVSGNVGLPDVGVENRIDESYDDGGEIMVEIVGADVFVDGVSSNEKDDDFLSDDIGGFDTGDVPGFTSVGDGGRLVESGLEVSGSRIGLSKEVDVSFNTESVAVSSVEMLNSVVQEMTVTTTTTQSIVKRTEEVAGRLSVEVSEGMMTTSELLNEMPVTTTETMTTQSTVTRTEEVTNRSSVEVSEGMVTTSELLNEMPVTTSEMTESITTHTEEVTERTSVLVSEEMVTEDADLENQGKVAKGREFDDGENLVTAVIEGEVGSAAEIIRDSAVKDEGVENNNVSSASCALPEHISAPVEVSVAEEIANCSASQHVSSFEDVRAADAGQIMPNEVSVNQDCEFLDSDQGFKGNEVLYDDHKQISPSQTVNMNCTASAFGKADPTSGGEEITDDMSDGGISGTSDGSAKLGLASESKDLILERDGPHSDLKDENINYDATYDIDNASHGQSFGSEREEAMDVDFDVVLDFKDEDFNPPGTSNDEIFESVGDFGIDDFASEPGDFGDTAEPNLGKGLIDHLRAGYDENLAHTGEEHVQADSGMCIDQLVIDTPMTEATNDQIIETSQVNIVDEDEPSKDGVGFDTEFGENHAAVKNPIANAEIELPNPVEKRESPQIKDVSVSLQENETADDGIDVLEDISSLRNEVDSATVFSDSNVNTSLKSTENTELASSNDDTVKSRESDVSSGTSGDDHVSENHTSEMDMEQETEPGQEYWQEKEIDEPLSEIDTPKLISKDRMKSSSNLRLNQSGYLSENDGNFAVSDLVWGKVKGHPWWPGQIFNPEDASKKGMKHYKKDSYLVAYFGDRTFAWNDASFLKPFRSQFPQAVKQSTSEAFQNAVDCALEEVSRRVELGLSCSCTPKKAFGKITTQILDNSGIREESSRRNGVDQSCKATNFEPGEFLQYVRDLARRTCSGVNHLDVVIAQAQVSAFCRYKGYCGPTEFPAAGELLENDVAIEKPSNEVVYSRKSKRVPKENILEDFEYTPDDEDDVVASLYSSRKRKAVESLADGLSDKRVNVKSAKKSNGHPKTSFKIGECIRRVASQLTGSTAVVKSTHDGLGSNGLINEQSEETPSVIDMLSRLELLAQSPNKQYSFKDQTVNFFSGFRRSVVVNKRGGRKRKAGKMVGMSAEEFEFDDVSDSYWTDRIVQNYSEKQLLHDNEYGAGEEPVARVDGEEKTVKPGGRKSQSRRIFYKSSHPNVTNEVDEKVKRLKQESSPAELILNFAERKFIPSEINLNKTFRRFGALMESETEVDHESGRARVIFKRGSDAEAARDSAQRFNILGPVLVNYQIGYTPLISVKVSNIALPQVQEDGVLML